MSTNGDAAAGNARRSPRKITIRVHVIGPSFDVPGCCTLNNVPLSLTVGELRIRLAQIIRSHPTAATLRMYFAGRSLHIDNATIAQVICPLEVCFFANLANQSLEWQLIKTNLGRRIYVSPCAAAD